MFIGEEMKLTMAIGKPPSRRFLMQNILPKALARSE